MSTDSLPSWRPGPTKEAVVEFVTAVTDDGSPDYVAEVDRVAVFDNDGTLSTEMPLYTQLAFAFDRAAALGKAATMEELKAGGLPAVLELVKLTHGSISTDDFEAVVQEWAASSTHARFERLYTSLVYQPMLEAPRLPQSQWLLMLDLLGRWRRLHAGLGAGGVRHRPAPDHRQHRDGDL